MGTPWMWHPFEQGWHPPRGWVRIERTKTGLALRCQACGAHRAEDTTVADAQQAKRNHRCPPGTLGAFPKCPDCDSTGPKCRDAGGGWTVYWHGDRNTLRHAVPERKAVQW